MNRRQFMLGSLAGGTLLGAGGFMWLRNGADKSAFSIEASLAQLDALAGKTIPSTGEWDAFKIFAHCAQSVEYSMTGYPQHKSRFFKSTIGKLAFSVFSARGKMSHSLSEPIPGAPALHSAPDVDAALTRLRNALTDFRDFQGDLEPHFAYGRLSKDAYTLAHIIHLNNHLEQIEV